MRSALLVVSDLDLRVERCARRADAEERAVRPVQLPVAPIRARRRRRGQGHGEVGGLPRQHLAGERHRPRVAHHRAADEHHRVHGGAWPPGAVAVVPQLPGLDKARARRDDGVVRDGHVGQVGRPVGARDRVGQKRGAIRRRGRCHPSADNQKHRCRDSDYGETPSAAASSPRPICSALSTHDDPSLRVSPWDTCALQRLSAAPTIISHWRAPSCGRADKNTGLEGCVPARKRPANSLTRHVVCNTMLTDRDNDRGSPSRSTPRRLTHSVRKIRRNSAAPRYARSCR